MTWIRLEDPATTRAYYYNETTQVTQWEFPEDVYVTTLSKYGWNKADADGRTYFYNEESGESVWNIPDDVFNDLKKLFGESLTEEEIKGETIQNESQIENEREEEKNKGNEESNIVEDNVFQETENLSEPKIEEAKNFCLVNQLLGIDELKLNPKIIDKEKEKEEEKDDQKFESEYKEMIETMNIGKDLNFKGFMIKAINDERYWNIKSPMRRKELFESYITEQENKEFLSFKSKYKSEFYEILSKHNIKYYSRWNSIKDIIKNEPIYKKLNEDIKLDFFNSYIYELKNERDKLSKEAKAKESSLLETELLKNVKMDSEFAKIVLSLEEKYKNLTKSEMLDVFDKVIQQVEKEHLKNIEIEKKLNYSYDRKSRQSFKNMITKLIENGTLKPTSQLKWYEFVNVIQDTPEFNELCGHRGSSAIDYYWDIMDSEMQKLESKVENFKRQLINLNKKIDDLKDETEFVKIMKNCDKDEIKTVSEQDMRSIYKLIAPSKGLKRSLETSSISDKGKRQKISFRGS